MKIVAVRPEQIMDWWPHARKGLDNLLEHHTLGVYTEMDILDKLQHAEWQLFVVARDDGRIQACLVCAIAGDHIFEVAFCWGEGAADWTGEVFDVFAAIGRELDCDKMTLTGRPGWTKMAKKLGFEVNSIVFARDI